MEADCAKSGDVFRGKTELRRIFARKRWYSFLCSTFFFIIKLDSYFDNQGQTQGENKMEILQATMKELEELTILFDEYRQFYGIESDVSSAKAFLQLRMALQESIIFIVVEKNKAIGFAQLYPTFSSIALQRAYILNDLYVTEDARGQGVGKALMEKVFQYCEQQYARYVTLQTAPDNVNARKLYEKLEMMQDQYSNYVKYFS